MISIVNIAMQATNILKFALSEMDRLNNYLREGKRNSSLDCTEEKSIGKRLTFLDKVRSDIKEIIKLIDHIKSAHAGARVNYIKKMVKAVYKFNERHKVNLEQSYMEIGPVTIS